MNDATLEGFRMIAAAMQTAPTDWQWIGPYMSQRMFGITEQRAKDYAAKHGGQARQMECSGSTGSLQAFSINPKGN